MENIVTAKLKSIWQRYKRKKWLKTLRRENHNHDFSLITNDCIGGVIYHDLGEQFRSPTVNLWIPNDCFLEFAQNLSYYLTCDMIETPDVTKPYPVGKIIPKDNSHIPIVVNFMHYSSFDEAYSKWAERSSRVNYQRLYFIWHFYDDEHTERLEAFENWNSRRLAIVHEPLSGFHDLEVTRCYDKEPYNGKILSVIEESGRRYLDEIDYIGFLNRKE